MSDKPGSLLIINVSVPHILRCMVCAQYNSHFPLRFEGSNNSAPGPSKFIIRSQSRCIDRSKHNMNLEFLALVLDLLLIHDNWDNWALVQAIYKYIIYPSLSSKGRRCSIPLRHFAHSCSAGPGASPGCRYIRWALMEENTSRDRRKAFRPESRVTRWPVDI